MSFDTLKVRLCDSVTEQNTQDLVFYVTVHYWCGPIHATSQNPKKELTETWSITIQEGLTQDKSSVKSFLCQFFCIEDLVIHVYEAQWLSGHAANLISTLFMLESDWVFVEHDSTSLRWLKWKQHGPFQTVLTSLWSRFRPRSSELNVFRSEGRKRGLNRTLWRTADKQGSTVTGHKLLFFYIICRWLVCFAQCSGCRVWTACMKYCILRIEKANLGMLMMTMSIKNDKMYTIMQKGNLHCNLVYCITKLTLWEM